MTPAAGARVNPGPWPGSGIGRFIHLYLTGYFVLVFSAGLTLWQAGVVHGMSGGWSAFATIVVVGLGLLVSVTSAKPAVAKND